MGSLPAIISVIVGTIIIIVGVVLGWSVFPSMVETQIGENVELKNGTDQYKRFKNLPISFDFKVYLFTIENRDEANKGKKPKMKEVGPYIYKQTRHKENIIWDDSDTISYNEYQHYEFNEDASKTKDTDVITVLNPALNGVLQILDMQNLKEIKALINDDKVRELIFGEKDIYLTTTVKQFLFDGYNLCEQSKLEEAQKTDMILYLKASVACLGLMAIPAKNIKPAKDKLVFTFLNHKNTTHDGLYTVNNGIKDKQKLAVIQEWEGKSHLEFWGANDTKCNQVRGRDAVIFPPFVNEKSALTVFNTDICRTVDLHYKGDVVFRDVTAMEFILPEDTLSAPDEKLDNKCYCLNSISNVNGMVHKNGCARKGILELFTCYNAHIILSFPHFLWADKIYQNSVDGMKPVEQNHRTAVLLEPNTGTPLSGSKRVQFNMFVRKIDGIKMLENYETPRLMPILWLDEHVDITDVLYEVLYDSYISKTYIIEGVKWGIIALGIVVIILTVVIHVWRTRKAKQTV